MAEDKRAGGFLSRWSQRKTRAREAERTPSPPETAAASDAEPDEPEDAIDPERAERLRANQEAAAAVDIDSLEAGSDFTLFMREGVSPTLRRAALRRLFRVNPILANLDGLVDHGEDFQDGSMVPAQFKSAWRTGRGYLKRMSEQGAEAAESTEAAPEQVDDRPDDPPPASAADRNEPETPQEAAAPADRTDDGAVARPEERTTLRARLGMATKAST